MTGIPYISIFELGWAVGGMASAGSFLQVHITFTISRVLMFRTRTSARSWCESPHLFFQTWQVPDELPWRILGTENRVCLQEAMRENLLLISPWGLRMIPVMATNTPQPSLPPCISGQTSINSGWSFAFFFVGGLYFYLFRFSNEKWMQLTNPAS